jgi:hypothetical protein
MELDRPMSLQQHNEGHPVYGFLSTQPSHIDRTQKESSVLSVCALPASRCSACLRRPPSGVCLRRSRPLSHPKGTPREWSGTAPAVVAGAGRQAEQREWALRDRGGGTPPCEVEPAAVRCDPVPAIVSRGAPRSQAASARAWTSRAVRLRVSPSRGG